MGNVSLNFKSCEFQHTNGIRTLKILLESVNGEHWNFLIWELETQLSFWEVGQVEIDSIGTEFKVSSNINKWIYTLNSRLPGVGEIFSWEPAL